jgi:hypothetical protein
MSAASRGWSARRKLATSVLVLGALASVLTERTLALFSDSDGVGANAFTNSTINLTTNPTSALVTFAGMQPGDAVTSAVVVTNGAGSAPLRYSVASSATNTDNLGLKDQLVLTVKTIDVTVPATPCDNFDGTQLYSGDLDSSAGKIVGDSASGSHSGDRLLAASGAETLCFRVSEPTSTGNAFKNATTTATFTFDSEQTTNN